MATINTQKNLPIPHSQVYKKPDSNKANVAPQSSDWQPDKIALSPTALSKLYLDKKENNESDAEQLPAHIKVLKEYIESLKEQIEDAKKALDAVKNKAYANQQEKQLALETATNFLISLTNALSEANLNLQQALKDAGKI